MIEKSLYNPQEENAVKSLELLRGNFQLKLTPSNSELIQNFIRDVNEYVTVSNQYLNCKTSEEQAKVSLFVD